MKRSVAAATTAIAVFACALSSPLFAADAMKKGSEAKAASKSADKKAMKGGNDAKKK